MVAQVTLDHLVWVRVLVPEPFLFFWRYGQAAKTSPSQGEITGSIPVSATRLFHPMLWYGVFLFYHSRKFIELKKLTKNILVSFYFD